MDGPCARAPRGRRALPRLWAERRLQEIRLKELRKNACERLVRQALGNDVNRETVERIVQQADGHAFYLEELIRAVAEGRGAALPETVLAMVEARLAGLDDEARRVLRAASVFGEVCWAGGVSALQGGATHDRPVSEWLSSLVEQEVLVERPQGRFPGERELAFRHALLREGAYAMLTQEDRTLGHRLAGEWLEQRERATRSCSPSTSSEAASRPAPGPSTSAPWRRRTSAERRRRRSRALGARSPPTCQRACASSSSAFSAPPTCTAPGR